MSRSAAEPLCRLPVRRPLVPVLTAICAGILLDRALSLGLLVWIAIALSCWAAWFALHRRRSMALSCTALMLASAAMAAGWHHARWNLFRADEAGLASREHADPVCFEGRVLGGPWRVPAAPFDPMSTVPRVERSRLKLEVLAVRHGAQWLPASGRTTLAVDGQLLGVAAGDRVQAFAQWNAAPRPSNPGEFDYGKHLRSERQLCLARCAYPECVSVVSRADGWNLSSALDHLRRRGDAILWRYLDPDRAGLAAAMFLGLHDELDAEQSQAFLETGTVHLLVISGLNVGILAGCLFAPWWLGLCSRRTAAWMVAAVTVLYAAVTGAQPPVVRATVMVLVVCVAMARGRRTSTINTLAAAAILVLVLNPTELFLAGTQMSFLAVATLIWHAERIGAKPVDPLDRLIATSRPRVVRWARRGGRFVWVSLIVSGAVWLAVCPLVMARFHLASPVAVILGAAAAVFVWLAMASGFAVLALGWLAPPLAALLAYVCDKSLQCLLAMVSFARTLPASHLWLPGPSWWWLAGLYSALGVWLVVPRLRPSRRWFVALLSAWIAIGLGASLLRPRETGLEATFVSVGHGCGVVMRLPDGRTLLYDAGRMGSPTGASRSIAACLWSQGITHLDAIVVSHADTDHFNALPTLVRQFSVGVVYVSPVMFEDPRGAVGALKESLEAARVSVRTICAGDRLEAFDSCSIDVLHPPRRGVLGSDNANSIVLAIESGGRRLLLTGDLESPGLEDVMAEQPWDCDVLLAPHHGSRLSNPPGFARWCRPEWVVVSGGASDLAAGGALGYQGASTNVLHTAEVGAVRVRFEPQALRVDSFRQPLAAPSIESR